MLNKPVTVEILSDDVEKIAHGRRFKAVFPGLLMILALAALDQNIVSTALPRIVSSLGGIIYRFAFPRPTDSLLPHGNFQIV